MEPIVFNTLENAQDVAKVARIFGKDRPAYQLKPNPFLVVLVGSPGVGKTTKAREFLKKELGVDYNDFYNIALDSLVERVRPYRAATKHLYNTIKAKRSGAPLRNENFAALSEVYLPTIMSSQANFKLPYTIARLTDKIEGKKAEAKSKPPPKPKAVNGEPKPKAANGARATKKKMCDGEDGAGALMCLNRLRREGLVYAVANGLNILYDTTLTAGNDKIKNDIMPILELNKDVKYKIVVILVKAPGEIIRKRLDKRHREMLEEENPYIRAVSPHLIKMFVEDNRKGFDNARHYFLKGSYESEVDDTVYSARDFSFKEIYNPDAVKSIKKN
jgi:dephospho-CoA kinase